MDKIKELKVEIFDIIAAQEQVRAQFDQLEQHKVAKLKELQGLLSGETSEKTIEATA